jgi:hypothetical protein
MDVEAASSVMLKPYESFRITDSTLIPEVGEVGGLRCKDRSRGSPTPADTVAVPLVGEHVLPEAPVAIAPVDRANALRDDMTSAVAVDSTAPPPFRR